MTACASTVLDVADFLDTPAAALVRAVMAATLPPDTDTGASADYYAARLPELGLNLQQQIAAVAAVVPGARARAVEPAGTPAGFDHAEMARLRDALFTASDATRRGMIEHCLDHATAGPAAVPIADTDQSGAGRVTVDPADRNTASAYFCPQPYAGWRSGLTSVRGDVACLIAGRDKRLGLLLGPAITFNGSVDGMGGETLPPGLVLCGPRAALAPGRYWLDIKITLAAVDCLHLDIASNRGLRRLAEVDLCGSFRMMLGFDVAATDDAIEVRLTNPAANPVAARIGGLAVRR
jgi:hypothetical protein